MFDCIVSVQSLCLTKKSRNWNENDYFIHYLRS